MSNMGKKLANELAKQERLMADLHVCAAVKVTAFDPATMTVDVQPLMQRPQDGGYQTQPPVLGIPVGYTLGGGYIVRPWYKPGDVGVVVYMDQDMDAALLSGDISPPSTQRRHAPDDAVFIGGIVTGGKAISGLPDDALVLATESGSIF